MSRNETIPISEYYEGQRRKLIITIIRSDQEDPITDICTNKDTLKLKSYDTRRVGRPRFNWREYGLKHYWEYLIEKHLTHRRGQDFSFDNREHVALIQQAVHNGWGQDGDV